jgi:hypothetical protein
MSRCELDIELQDERYFPGDMIRGRATARVARPCDCKRLTVGLVLVVNGMHQPSDRLQQLCSQRWEPGEHSYPFTMRAPDGPVQHLGEHLDVHWIVVALASVSPGADAEAKVPVVLRMPESIGLVVLPEEQGDRDKVEVPPDHIEPRGLLCRHLRSGSLALASAAMVGIGIAISSSGPVVVGLVSGFLAGLLFRDEYTAEPLLAGQRAFERSAGRPQLCLEQSSQQVRSNAFDCTVWVQPSAPDLDVQVTLTVEERVAGASDTPDEVGCLFAHTEPLRLSAPGCYRGTVPLPPAHRVPVSFQCFGSTIDWKLAARLRMQDQESDYQVGTRLIVRTTVFLDQDNNPAGVGAQ